jgi:hypothetical protein
VILITLGVNALSSRFHMIYNALVSPVVLTLSPLIYLKLLPKENLIEMGDYASWTSLVVTLSFVTQVCGVG